MRKKPLSSNVYAQNQGTLNRNPLKLQVFYKSYTSPFKLFICLFIFPTVRAWVRHTSEGQGPRNGFQLTGSKFLNI